MVYENWFIPDQIIAWIILYIEESAPQTLLKPTVPEDNRSHPLSPNSYHMDSSKDGAD